MPTLAAPHVVAEADETRRFTVSLTLLEGYAFRVDFGDDAVQSLNTDEPSPLGSGTGPAPSRLLAAAVVNCLASSLLFCLRKSRTEVEGLSADVTATVSRNERGRSRIERLDVLLNPSIPQDQRDRLLRCVDLFQDFCTVTESVRHGIDVHVTVAVAETASQAR